MGLSHSSMQAMPKNICLLSSLDTHANGTPGTWGVYLTSCCRGYSFCRPCIWRRTRPPALSKGPLTLCSALCLCYSFCFPDSTIQRKSVLLPHFIYKIAKVWRGNLTDSGPSGIQTQVVRPSHHACGRSLALIPTRIPTVGFGSTRMLGSRGNVLGGPCPPLERGTYIPVPHSAVDTLQGYEM